MNAEPFVYHVSQISTDEQEASWSPHSSRLHPVQVDSACELAPIELHLMIPRLHVAIDELGTSARVC